MSELDRRRIFLGPHHLEQIRIFHKFVNLPIFQNKDNPSTVDFRGIFFSTMIQCGVEEFVLTSINKEQDTPKFNSDFLSSRIIFDSKLDHQWAITYTQFRSLFGEYHEDENLDEKNKNELHAAEMFLTDLLLGMKTNLGTVNIPFYPNLNLERLQTFLAPELYYPIKNLKSLIENDNLNLPLPTESILHQNIRKYEEIINSGFFSKYVQSHQDFENNTIPKSRALTQIRKTAINLQNQFSNHVSLKKMGINSLRIVPIGAEIFGGKICGNVAEGLLKIFEPICKDNLLNDRRLVTYQFSPITEDILKNRLNLLVKE
jgi:hypothetical protein